MEEEDVAVVISKQERLKMLAEQQEVINAVWYDNVPTKGENPSRQYPLIASNFQVIKEANNANHFDIKDPKKRGLHTRIDMLPFKDDPPDIGCVPAFATLFAKEDCKLYYRSQCNGKVYDLIGQFSNQQKGYHKFTSGFLVQWDTLGVKNNQTVNFPIAFPNACFGVLAQLYRGNSDVRSLHVKEGNTNQVKWVALTNATTGTNIFYIAIGW